MKQRNSWQISTNGIGVKVKNGRSAHKSRALNRKKKPLKSIVWSCKISCNINYLHTKK
jgi:hypothetical protein